jgi:hypothetical protein
LYPNVVAKTINLAAILYSFNIFSDKLFILRLTSQQHVRPNGIQ